MAQAAGDVQPSRRRKAGVLPRELADFLVEFSIVLNHRAMYPDGHPQLQRATERFVHRLEALLASRGALALGVAHRHLLIESVATDPGNALLRDLAVRLHRHQLASLRFESGISLGEVDDLLGALAADPTRGEGPLGRRVQQRTGHWQHLRIVAVDYDRFAVDDQLLNPADGPRDGDELWVGLAQLALGTDESADSPLVARAIESQTGEVAYDRVVLDYLARIAEEMSGRVSPAEDRLRQRVSSLIENFDPKTLRRLLGAGAGQDVREFTLNSSQVLAVDAVVQVLEAAADVSQQTVSHHLLRMLHKLAHHAKHGSNEQRTEADGALRQNVARLVAGWQLADPNPGAYTAILDDMTRERSWDFTATSSADADPEVILQMGLEIGSSGPRVLGAADRLLARGRLERVLDILRAAPRRRSAAEPIWQRVATPDRLRAVLRLTPLDRELAGKLVARMGEQAIEPLLDQLETTQDRPTRAWLLGLLTGFGGAAAARAVARLRNSHWHLQRNLLVLLQRIGSWPTDFSPLEWLSHAEPAVRREALKLALKHDEVRAAALVSALADTDGRVLLLALAAARECCPAEAVVALEALAGDRRRDGDVRVRALKALGRTPPLRPGLALRRFAAVRWRAGMAMLRALGRGTLWRSVRAYAAARARGT
ncbi:MAG: hypothetical protein ACREOF_11420 [Gemmatimonadales bacterium]